jgi:hypothetical protein
MRKGNKKNKLRDCRISIDSKKKNKCRKWKAREKVRMNEYWTTEATVK